MLSTKLSSYFKREFCYFYGAQLLPLLFLFQAIVADFQHPKVKLTVSLNGSEFDQIKG